MPKIPSYESQVGIKTASAMPEISMQPIKESEREAKAAVAQIKEYENKLVELRNFRQTSEASAFSLDRVYSVLGLAESDTENLDPAKYYEEIDKIGPEASKNISDQIEREKFSFDFGKQALAAKAKIRDMFRTREIDSLKGTIAYQGQQILDNPPDDLSDPLHNTTILQYRQQFDKAVEIGLYNRNEANFEFGKFLKDLTKGGLSKDIILNPEFAKTELQKGNEGIYNNLTSIERVDFIKSADARIEKLAKQEEEATAIAIDKNESNIIVMKNNKDPNLNENFLRKQREDGNISPKFEEAMIRAIRSPKTVNAKTKNSKFIDMAYDIINTNVKDEKGKVIVTPQENKISIINMNATGDLSDEDAIILNTFNDIISDKDIDKVLPKQRHLFGLLQWGVDANLRPGIRARAFKSYMQKINNNISPEVAVMEVKQEIQRINPKRSMYDLNEIINTPRGPVKVIGFDDDGEPIIQKI